MQESRRLPMDRNPLRTPSRLRAQRALIAVPAVGPRANSDFRPRFLTTPLSSPGFRLVMSCFDAPERVYENLTLSGMSCQEACTISAYYFCGGAEPLVLGGIARRRVQDSQCAARDQIAIGMVSGWYAYRAITSENEAEANWRDFCGCDAFWWTFSKLHPRWKQPF